MPAPVVVSAGELFVWFALLVLLSWGGSTALQRLVALRFGGFVNMGIDYAAAGRDGLLPRFAPPAFLYGPVWAALYGLLAAAGYRLRDSGNWTDAASLSRTPLALYATTLALLFIWPAVYSGAMLRRLGNAVHASALALAIANAVLSWDVDLFAACVFIALATWLAYALLVALGIERARSAAAARCDGTGVGVAGPAGAVADPCAGAGAGGAAAGALPRYGRAGSTPGGGSFSVIVAPPDAYGGPAMQAPMQAPMAPTVPGPAFGAVGAALQAPPAPSAEQRRAMAQEEERRALAAARAEKRRAADEALWRSGSPRVQSVPRVSVQPRQCSGRDADADGPIVGAPGTFNDTEDLDLDV